MIKITFKKLFFGNHFYKGYVEVSFPDSEACTSGCVFMGASSCHISIGSGPRKLCRRKGIDVLCVLKNYKRISGDSHD